MARKKRSEQPDENKEAKKRDTPADSRPVPNQLAPVYDRADWPWPELYLMKSDGGCHPTGLLFVDDVHKMVDWWSRDSKAPPTWMDPAVFTRLLLADKVVVDLLDKTVAANSQEKYAPELLKEMERVFVNEYLVYTLRQFRKSKSMYSQWLMARYTCVEKDVKDGKLGSEGSAGGVGPGAQQRDGGSGGKNVKPRRVRRPARA